MKTKLLKRVRKNNPVYKKGHKYKYMCLNKCSGDVYEHESDWVDDLNSLLPIRRKHILNDARKLFNDASFIYKRKKCIRVL
jgi:hypothetical protein